MMPTDHNHLDMVRTAATKYGLDAALVCAVIEQESAWDPWAVRYEPQFYAHYIQPLLDASKIKTRTEATMRATSFGLGQVMGQVAREMGFEGRWLTQLCDPATGIDMCCKVLKHKLDAASSVVGGLQMYNGGGNPTYSSEVLARLSKYQEEIV